MIGHHPVRFPMVTCEARRKIMFLASVPGLSTTRPRESRTSNLELKLASDAELATPAPAFRQVLFVSVPMMRSRSACE
jgi:hypothetical protein